jgi:hypothetical protein
MLSCLRELASAALALFCVTTLCWALWGLIVPALFWTGAICLIVIGARVLVAWLFDRLAL